MIFLFPPFLDKPISILTVIFIIVPGLNDWVFLDVVLYLLPMNMPNTTILLHTKFPALPRRRVIQVYIDTWFWNSNLHCCHEGWAKRMRGEWDGGNVEF
jgi:hypothetical protein